MSSFGDEGSGAAVAVVIPCRDEAPTIERVIDGFRQVLPEAEIVVCDNASSDATAQLAAAAGARVVSEPQPGKGRAVRRLLADVDLQHGCRHQVGNLEAGQTGAERFLMPKPSAEQQPFQPGFASAKLSHHLRRAIAVQIGRLDLPHRLGPALETRAHELSHSPITVDGSDDQLERAQA